jgi:hypothetical protein
MSATSRRVFPKPPDMVSVIEPKTHGMGKCEQFTELTVHFVIKIAQNHLDPFLKVSLQEGPPILVQTINRQRLHFLHSNVPSRANDFKDKVCPPLHSLTKAASFPL